EVGFGEVLLAVLDVRQLIRGAVVGPRDRLVADDHQRRVSLSGLDQLLLERAASFVARPSSGAVVEVGAPATAEDAVVTLYQPGERLPRFCGQRLNRVATFHVAGNLAPQSDRSQASAVESGVRESPRDVHHRARPRPHHGSQQALNSNSMAVMLDISPSSFGGRPLRSTAATTALRASASLHDSRSTSSPWLLVTCQRYAPEGGTIGPITVAYGIVATSAIVVTA